MADSAYRVVIPGLDGFVRRLTPALFRDFLVDVVTEATLVAEAAARQGSPMDTGALARSWTSEVRGLSGRVYSTLGYAAVMDQGRSAGARPPPPDALVGWMVRHGMIGVDPWVLARAISRRGIRGRFFVRAAVEATVAALPGIVQRSVARVEASWGARS